MSSLQRRDEIRLRAVRQALELLGALCTRGPEHYEKNRHLVSGQAGVRRCKKLRIVTCGISGGRPLTRPFSLDTMVPRTHMYTYVAKVWVLLVVQGPFPVAQTLASRFATCASLYRQIAELIDQVNR